MATPHQIPYALSIGMGRISGKTDPTTLKTWYPLRTAHADFSHRFNRENRINYVQKVWHNCIGIIFSFFKKDLITIAETIELCQDNNNAYGPRITQLMLSTGSELGVALKSFLTVISPNSGITSKRQANMGDYRKLINEKALEQFSTAQVKILRSEIRLAPWSYLKDGAENTLPRWKAYSEIKRHRAECYSKGTLEVVLNLIAALFIVNSYIAEASLRDNWIHSNYRLGPSCACASA